MHPGASRVVLLEWCRHAYGASRQLKAWPGGEGSFSGTANKDIVNLLCVTTALNRNMCLIYTYIKCIYTYWGICTTVSYRSFKQTVVVLCPNVVDMLPYSIYTSHLRTFSFFSLCLKWLVFSVIFFFLGNHLYSCHCFSSLNLTVFSKSSSRAE